MQTRKLVVAAAVAGVSVLGFASAVSANILDSATDATSIVDDATNLVDADADTNADTDVDTNADTDLVTDVAQWFYVKNDGALIEAKNNNIGPFQACHNNVGGVAGSDIVGLVGLDNEGNTATVVKTCEQSSEQSNTSNENDTDAPMPSTDNGSNILPQQLRKTGLVDADADTDAGTDASTNADTDAITDVDSWFKATSDGVVSVSNTNTGPFQACHNTVSVADTGDVTDLGSILPMDNTDNATDVMKTCEQTSSQSNTSSDSDNG